MYIKTIEYEDFNGVKRKEDFLFNMNESELMELQYGMEGGFTEYVKHILKKQDTPALMSVFKKLILASYGEKSSDGRRFIKSEELSKEFSQTNAYSKLYMEFASSEKAASDFFNGIVSTNSISKKEREKKVLELKKELGYENQNATSTDTEPIETVEGEVSDK